jgi:hypothetical protein
MSRNLWLQLLIGGAVFDAAASAHFPFLIASMWLRNGTLGEIGESNFGEVRKQ